MCARPWSVCNGAALTTPWAASSFWSPAGRLETYWALAFSRAAKIRAGL
jgi:hypothetical protein